MPRTSKRYQSNAHTPGRSPSDVGLTRSKVDRAATPPAGGALGASHRPGGGRSKASRCPSRSVSCGRGRPYPLPRYLTAPGHAAPEVTAPSSRGPTWLVVFRPPTERSGRLPALASQPCTCLTRGRRAARSHRRPRPGARRRGEARQSPHALVQDYLNRSDCLWGLVTNGRKLRLLRDSKRFARPTYVEFDLEAMVAGNLYSEFVVLFRLAQRTRLPQGTADAHESWLERYYQQGIAEGGRVRERLSEGVFQARVRSAAASSSPRQHEVARGLRHGGIDEHEYYRQLFASATASFPHGRRAAPALARPRPRERRPPADLHRLVQHLPPAPARRASFHRRSPQRPV